MTQNLPPELDLEEGEVEALFARFRIPPEEAQEMLDQTLVTLCLRYPNLRQARFWVLQTLKRRCALWWRRRTRRSYRVADVGFRRALTSSDFSREERDRMRENLRRWTAALRPRCREVLSRRYGLSGGEVTAPPGSAAEEHAKLEAQSDGPLAPSDNVLYCVGALLRRMRAELGGGEDEEAGEKTAGDAIAADPDAVSDDG